MTRTIRSWTVLMAVGLAIVIPTASSSDNGRPSPDRRSLIAKSKVWQPTDIPSMDLRIGDTGPAYFPPGSTIRCEYLDKKLTGASPKFACRLPDGDELKVKYGGANGEVYAEVAASRLLWALGFGADRMYSVRLICQGCPRHLSGAIRQRNGDYVLDPVAIERKMPGEALVDKWDWEELDQTDPSAGGATKAERDAFKLLAVLLQHSDSKAKQQRIICVQGWDEEDGTCAMPLMMINDLGVTFGRANAFNQQPRASVNLAEWARLPVWKGPGGCVGNLSGSFTGTLKDPEISEEGRQFLADLLMRLSDQQIRDMFEAARIHLRPRSPADGRSGFPSVDEWVSAFKTKRAEIVDRRCTAPA